jgi:hypothetical protein
MGDAGNPRDMRVGVRDARYRINPCVLVAGRDQSLPEGESAVRGHGTVQTSKKAGQNLDGCGM